MEGDPWLCHQVLAGLFTLLEPLASAAAVGSVPPCALPLWVHLLLPQAMVWLRHPAAGCAKRAALCIPTGAAAGTCFSMLGVAVFCSGHME